MKPIKDNNTYQDFLADDTTFSSLTKDLTDKETLNGLSLREEEVKNYEAIEKVNSGTHEKENIPLWLKRSKPSNFMNDEFTDYDISSYYSYLFNKKYPLVSALADYGSVGIGTCVDRMRETLKTGRWGFYSYSTGGHWILVVLSPKSEVICLDSVGEGQLTAEKLPKMIQKDIDSAFTQAMKFDPKTKLYYGLKTQTGIQCGLHSVLAAEEIIRAINQQITAEPQTVYELISMGKLCSAVTLGIIDDQKNYGVNKSDPNKPDSSNLQEEATQRNIEILRRISIGLPKNSFGLKESLTELLERQNTTKELFAEWYVENAAKIASLKDRYDTDLTSLMPIFSIENIVTKCKNQNDEITRKPSNREILMTRWNASNEQFEDQRQDALRDIIARQSGSSQTSNHQLEKKATELSANNVILEKHAFCTKAREPKNLKLSFINSETNTVFTKEIEMTASITKVTPKNTNITNPQFTVTTNNPNLVVKDYAEDSSGKFNNIVTGFIQKAKDESGLTDKEVGAIILIAIKNRGIGNDPVNLKKDLEVLQNTGLIITTKSIEDLAKAAIKFSGLFQKSAKQNQIYTGNENATSLEGMRLKRLDPSFAEQFLGEKYQAIYDKFKISEIEAKAQEEASPSVQPKSGVTVGQKANNNQQDA